MNEDINVEVNYNAINHVHNAFENIPFYRKYYEKIKDMTHASDTLIYSGMQFTLSLGLQNASLLSEMGAVRPNIAVMGIFPSGYSKSPMLNNIREVLKFWSFGHNNYIQGFETFSPEGIKSYLNKLSPEEKSKVFKMAILKDEVSTLAKSTKNGMMSTAGLEFLSGLFDGRVDQHDTRISGHETFPDEIYCPMWFTGTSGFWAHITNDWWTQGIAFRMIYPHPGDMDTRGIKLQYSNNNLEEEIKPFIDSLTTITNFIWDDDFKQLYEQKTHEIKNMQYQAILQNQSEEKEIQYYKKYPELILKLAMIHKAAMMKEPKKILIPGEIKQRYQLLLNKEDFEWAEQDFEMYKQGFLQAYDSYINAQSERYKRIDTSILESKFMKYYNIVKNEKKLTYNTNDDNTITKNEKGEWVKLSDVCRFANFNGFDKDAVIKSLLTKGLIEKERCINYHYEVDMVKIIL